MPISAADLENAIRAAIPVTHLEIEDTSNGCGENYEVFVVSPVSFHDERLTSHSLFTCTIGQAFEGKNTLARHRFSTHSFRTPHSFPAHPPSYLTVNEVLKEQIAQMHAFTQVRRTHACTSPLQALFTTCSVIEAGVIVN